MRKFINQCQIVVIAVRKVAYSENLIVYVLGFCGVPFQPSDDFYHEAGNQAETYKDQQAGGKESRNENQGVIETIGNDKYLYAKNQK